MFFQWQSFSNSSWSNLSNNAEFSGSNNDSLLINNFFNNDTSLTIRCLVSDSIPQQISDSSNAISITLFGKLTSGNIIGSDTICFNALPNSITFLNNPSQGGGLFNYNWQLSTDSINFNDIANATQNSYSPINLKQNSFYRARVTSQLGCGEDTTNSIKITVYDSLTPGIISGTDTICFNSSSNSLSLSTLPSGANNLFNYQWINSLNGINYLPIPNATSQSFQPPNLTSSTYYKLINNSVLGCGTDTSNFIRIHVYDSLSPPSIIGAQSICFNSITDTVFRTQKANGGNNLFNYSWEQKSGTGAWNAINGINDSIFISPILTNSTYFRLNASSNFGCGNVISDSILVIVFGKLQAGIIDSNQAICFGTSPNPLSFSTNPSFGGGSYSYQWQNSTDSVLFTNINNANTVSYSSTTLKQNTFFRNIVSSNLGCGNDTSNIIKINVYDSLTPATISGIDTICHNSSPNLFNISSLPAGANNLFNYQWLNSSNGINYSPIPNATAQTFQPPNLTSSTYYKLINSSSLGCGSDTSNFIRIHVYDSLTSPEIAGTQSICFNTVADTIFRTQKASGGNNLFSYFWEQKSGIGLWSPVSGINDSTFVSTPLLNSTYFRLNATSNFGCGNVIADSILVTVYGDLQAGVIDSNQAICFGTSPNQFTFSTTPSFGGGSYSYQWQNSTDSVSFTNINNANAINYSASTLKQNTFFRSIVSSNLGCGNDTSTIIKINVYDSLTPATISGIDTICYNSSPNLLNISSLPTGANNLFNYQWLNSLNGTNYSPIPNATTQTFQPSNLTSSTYYKLINSSTLGCGSDTSNFIRIHVYDSLTSPEITGTQSICFNTITDTIYRTQKASGGNNLFSYFWEQKSGAGSWSSVNGINDSILVSIPLLNSNFFRLNATSNFGCGNVISDSIIVTVYGKLQAGIIDSNQVICFDSSPNQLTFSINPSFGGGSYSYQWQNSTDSVSFTNINNATTVNYSSTTLKQNTFFRNIVSSNLGCGNDTSNIIKINVYDSLTPATISGVDTICFNSFTNSIQVVLDPVGGGNNFYYQWERSFDSFNWDSVSNDTLKFLRPTKLFDNTFFRVLSISKNQCGLVNSNPVFIKVNPLPSENNILGETVFCKNKSDVIYQMENSPDSIAFSWEVNNGQIQKVYSDTAVAVKWNNLDFSDTIKVIQTNIETECLNTMTLSVSTNAGTAPERTQIIRKPNTDILIAEDQSPNTKYQWGYFDKATNNYSDFIGDTLRYILLPTKFDTTQNLYCVKTKSENLENCETLSCLYQNPFVSIAEVQALHEISIFPTPTNGLLNIGANQPISSIEIFDLVGKVVFKKENINSNTETLNLRLFNPGVYLVNVWLHGGIIIQKKIVKS